MRFEKWLLTEQIQCLLFAPDSSSHSNGRGAQRQATTHLQDSKTAGGNSDHMVFSSALVLFFIVCVLQKKKMLA